MKTIIVACCLIGFVVCQQSTPAGVECLTDTECQAEECCYKKHELLASKRQTFEGHPLPTPIDYAHVKGVCEAYKMAGDICSNYDKPNGHCGCNPHQRLSCNFDQSHRVTAKVFFPGMPNWGHCTR